MVAISSIKHGWCAAKLRGSGKVADLLSWIQNSNLRVVSTKIIHQSMVDGFQDEANFRGNPVILDRPVVFLLLDHGSGEELSPYEALHGVKSVLQSNFPG